MTSLPRRIAAALLPRFWRAGTRLRPYSSLRSYPRAWALTVILLSAASLAPVTIIAGLDYKFTQRALHREHELQVSKLASNAKRTVAYFLEERLEALSFAARELRREKLTDSRELTVLLDNLKVDFGGFTDLGVIDETGRQVAYSGPFDLEGKEYGEQPWFGRCREHGAFVSDVFLGYRDVPHLFIAVQAPPETGPAFLLRATLDLGRLRRSLAPYASGENDDILLVNHLGIIQTPSRRHGAVFEDSPIGVPAESSRTEVLDLGGDRTERITVGYAYVSTRLADTPFILLLIRGGAEVGRFSSWLLTTRIILVACTCLGIVLLVGVASSYMFNHLYDTDVAKAHALGQMEDVNRLVSLGRLAAGVAHEINNPLAVINESAGYMQDLLAMRENKAEDAALAEQTEAILESVARCAGITRQLLSFSRRSDLLPGPVDIEALVRNILSFQKKEAEYRGITVGVDIAEDAREIHSDRGKLQEVILNLVINAVDAMPEGGELGLSTRSLGDDRVEIEVSDTGHGMPEEIRKSVFEPFFTTKPEGEGTGLGLSITYGLVERLGGTISVESTAGEGTTFKVALPRHITEVDKP